MRFLRRLLGVILLLLSTVGSAACVAGVVGIWIFHQNASRKVEDLSGRVEAALERAAVADEKVRAVLDKTRADVARVQEEAASLGNGREQDRLVSIALRKRLRERVGPNANDLGGRLTVYSEAADAVAPLLQSLQELPLGETGHVDASRLERASTQATQLADALQKLHAAAGEGDLPGTAREVAAAAERVNDILGQCQTTVDGWQSDLKAARAGLPGLKARLLYWLTLLALAVTVVCVWAGLGQLSLFAHGWKWCRGA